MESIGLGVDYQLVDFGRIVGQLTSTYDWESVIIGLTGSSDPGSGIGVWHSSAFLHLWHPLQSEPATAWEAQVDELYVKADRELDHEQRVAYYHEAQEIVAENVPLIFTTVEETIVAVRNTLGNTTGTLYGWSDGHYLYRTDQ